MLDLALLQLQGLGGAMADNNLQSVCVGRQREEKTQGLHHRRALGKFKPILIFLAHVHPYCSLESKDTSLKLAGKKPKKTRSICQMN